MFSSIVEAIKYYAVETPDKLCLRYSKRCVTYSEYFSLIEKNATFFVKQKVRKGDCVILKAEQSIDYLSAFHGVQLAGGIPVPLEKNVKADRLSEVSAITVSRLCAGAENGEDQYSYDYISSSEDCIHGFSYPLESDTGEILFTTGTTGKSKGVVMTHSADVAVAQNVIFGVEMKKDNIEVIPIYVFSFRSP